VNGRPGDLLIVLSGSGNSANVVRALEIARSKGIRSFAILAFSGGRCLELAEVPIHFLIDDMQIAEDTQLVVGHLCMQWLNNNKPSDLTPLT
jgi:D-sedoheptulose 7-phosphate isomerase